MMCVFQRRLSARRLYISMVLLRRGILKNQTLHQYRHYRYRCRAFSKHKQSLIVPSVNLIFFTHRVVNLHSAILFAAFLGVIACDGFSFTHTFGGNSIGVNSVCHQPIFY